MKKSLLLSEIFPPVKGGSGRWFWELYSRLPKDKVVIAAGTTMDSGDFDKTHSLLTFRIDLSSFSWGVKSLTGLRYYWRAFWQVRKIVKEQKVELIHCGRCLPEGVIALLINKLSGIPYICYIHGEDVETAATSRELSWLVNKVLFNAQSLIANSQNTANILLQQWKTELSKTHVLHPGVDTSIFIPAPFDSQIKKQLGWQDKQVILTVGRLQKRKGHDMLIRAISTIRQHVPQVLYAIIGHGEERTNLNNLVAELNLQDHVLFMQEIDDKKMIQCYQQCNIFVLPNRTIGRDIEGFGMVLVEAQACGKPVIAGDSGGTAETMLLGESGCILDCTSPLSLAETLTDWLINPEQCRNMGESGRHHVESTLDWNKLTLKALRHFE
jgi:phosphatidyl-myo-inositol dimannoside synthase